MPSLTALDAATRHYHEAKRAFDNAQAAAITAVLDALRADHAPWDVAERGPFSAAYVRRLAREHGIAPARPGPKPRD